MALTEQDTGSIVSDINSRFRILESKNNTLAEHLLAVNQNTIEEYRRLNKEIELINEDLKKLREDVFNLKNILKGFLGETEFFAKKSDIKVLEKYINLWNPLEFVTQEEVEKIIEEKLMVSRQKKGGKAGRSKKR